MRRSTAPSPSAHAPVEASRPAGGFTLIELVVCMGVIAVLCGILLPSLRTTRETANRLRCATGMRQIGVATAAYADAHGGDLPYSSMVDPIAGSPRPGELMAARWNSLSGGTWEGVGRLQAYLGQACECMYCPSHHGRHTHDSYAERLRRPTNEPIYTNYHYCGHLQHWRQPGDPLFNARVTLDAGRDLVVLTDGMRTVSDFNHGNGFNQLFGDMSVEWYRDSEVPGESIRDMLPTSELQVATDDVTISAVWSRLTSQSGGR
jgi:prepilin-type N-terminal cleavage/methylation domain-containing protein